MIDYRFRVPFLARALNYSLRCTMALVALLALAAQLEARPESPPDPAIPSPTDTPLKASQQ